MRSLLIVIALFLTGCNNQEKEMLTKKCQQKGYEHFSSIGSYPRLSDGRFAKDIIKEKCNWHPHVFGEVKVDKSKIKPNYTLYYLIGIPAILFLLFMIIPIKTYSREEILEMEKKKKN